METIEKAEAALDAEGMITAALAADVVNEIS
jgi:hypothetical protein